ncbi:esterase/lipase family protein [Pyxidicoccus sp. MSG2]|uniref:esterase/lipase family protein n=1 Tax=Pyxidicoccus sp. MSG2 TaxID=2996790 RepID=UPI00226F5CB1|nr:triacylglycerol lipase [Pyxidicoccus sp. MSG2]MCY1014681.1 triacylglycerol lipase [Pyxidicoccus sp. MSG2]
MATRHRVYLVPGFFGFTQMGDAEAERIAYFQHVPALLQRRFKARNLDAEVHALASSPTSGLEARARAVLQEMAKTETEDGAQIHLVGHSTGGLDARGVVSLRMAPEAPAFVKRVRTVLTISTPHHGTPLASFFHQGDVGKTLLRYLWLFTFLALHRKAMPLRTAVLQALYRLVRMGEQAGIPPNLFNEIARLLADLSENEREGLLRYFDQIGENQELIHDLTPARVRIFNQDTPDREGVRYGSIITGAPPPSLLRRLSPRLLFPPDSLIYGIFSFLYRMSAPLSPELEIPERTEEQTRALREAFGRKFEAWSDGIVPSRSQVWGQLLHVVASDHLDVMGHFDQPEQYISWLKSGSHFQEPQFHEVWERVLDFTVGATRV